MGTLWTEKEMFLGFGGHVHLFLFTRSLKRRFGRADLHVRFISKMLPLTVKPNQPFRTVQVYEEIYFFSDESLPFWGIIERISEPFLLESSSSQHLLGIFQSFIQIKRLSVCGYS